MASSPSRTTKNGLLMPAFPKACRIRMMSFSKSSARRITASSGRIIAAEQKGCGWQIVKSQIYRSWSRERPQNGAERSEPGPETGWGEHPIRGNPLTARHGVDIRSGDDDAAFPPE